MGIRSYAPTDVDIIVGGFYKVSGFVEGSFIEISKDVNPYKTLRTADGRVARSYVKDSTYTVTLKLASTSPANEVLTKIHTVDELTQLGKFPLFIKDNQGSTFFLAPTAWIKEIPRTNFSDTVTERVWVIQAADANINIGGNRDSSTDLEDVAASLNLAVPFLRNILG